MRSHAEHGIGHWGADLGAPTVLTCSDGWGPVVGQLQEPGQGKLESRQERRAINLVLLDDLFGWLPRPAAADRHDPPEPIDDPVFLDPDGQVLPALLLVIPHPVTLPPRDELDRDRRDVLSGFGIPAQADPDHAIGAAAAVWEVNVLLRQGLIEQAEPDWVIRLVDPQEVFQFTIRIALRFAGGGLTISTP